MNKEKIITQIKSIHFGTFNRRSFWIALVGGFLMALIQHLGIGANLKIFSPLPQKPEVHADVLHSITPLLQRKPNTIKLKDKTGMSSLDVNAKAYIVVDMDTQEVLSASNANAKLPMASLTKVMSSVVALDLASTREQFTITKRAARVVPTKIGVVPGQKMMLGELLPAMLLTSANDATEAVRDGIDTLYGENIFVNAMNEKAQVLGLASSHFTNPQGFDNPNQYTSARDLAVLSLYAIKNYPQIADIAQKDYEFLPGNKYHKQFDLYNWNGLVGVYPNTFGLKIGVTEHAGNTTIVMARRGDKQIMAVVLGTDTIITRDLTAAQLLDEGFALEENLKPIAVDEQMLREKYGKWKYFN